MLSHSVPILLLPPSEGKATGGTPRTRWNPSSGSFATLANHRREVAETLAAAGGGDPRLLGVGGDHLDRARDANASLIGAPTLPAWQRYTGVVWDHLEPDTLTPEHLKRVIVVSGLMGLVRGDDPVPDYRLKMSANLAPVGKLSTWWRDNLSAALNRRLRRNVVIDLLPKEHRAAWLPDARVEGVSVELVDPTGKPGGHFAKAAKGRLAWALLTEGLDALDDWSDDRFDLAVTSL
jgi:cytoplasmic iron level regulating protein YaaA (DUF328/UPF0246 family)